MNFHRLKRKAQYCHRTLRLLALIDVGLTPEEAERIVGQTETQEWREVA